MPRTSIGEQLPRVRELLIDEGQGAELGDAVAEVERLMDLEQFGTDRYDRFDLIFVHGGASQ